MLGWRGRGERRLGYFGSFSLLPECMLNLLAVGCLDGEEEITQTHLRRCSRDTRRPNSQRPSKAAFGRTSQMPILKIQVFCHWKNSARPL